MQVKQIPYKSILNELENQYFNRYPVFFNNLKLHLNKLLGNIELIHKTLTNLLNAENKEYLISYIEDIVKEVHKFNTKKFCFVSMSSLNEFIEMFVELSKKQQNIKQAIHDMAHFPNMIVYLRTLFELLRQIRPNIINLRKEVDKNIVIYNYISGVFEETSQSLRKLQKQSAKSDNEDSLANYIQAYNSLYYKFSTSNLSKSKGQQLSTILNLYAERELLTKKLELFLENSKQLAFSYKMQESDLADDPSKPECFYSILNSLNSPTFVKHKILTFGLEDILCTIRELYNSDDEKNDNYSDSSSVELMFDEDVFIELYTNYHKTCLDLEYSGFKKIEDTVQNYKTNCPSEFKSLRDNGDKISS